MLKFSPASALAIVSGLILSSLVNYVIAQDLVSSFKEFTAEKVVKQYQMTTGIESIVATETEAFKSDGSRATFADRRFHAIGSRKAEHTQMLFTRDTSQGLMFTADPFTETVMSGQLTASEIRGLRRAPDCLTERNGTWVDLEPELGEILGFRVVKHTGESRNPLWGRGEAYDYDLLVVEKWLAPELDCYPLREVHRSVNSQSGNDRIVSTTDVISVKLGSPDKKWFEIPQNYVERPPSEYMREWARRRGEEGCAPCVAESTQRADGNYWSRRAGGN